MIQNRGLENKAKFIANHIEHARCHDRLVGSTCPNDSSHHQIMRNWARIERHVGWPRVRLCRSRHACQPGSGAMQSATLPSRGCRASPPPKTTAFPLSNHFRYFSFRTGRQTYRQAHLHYCMLHFRFGTASGCHASERHFFPCRRSFFGVVLRPVLPSMPQSLY